MQRKRITPVCFSQESSVCSNRTEQCFECAGSRYIGRGDLEQVWEDRCSESAAVGFSAFCICHLPSLLISVSLQWTSLLLIHTLSCLDHHIMMFPCFVLYFSWSPLVSTNWLLVRWDPAGQIIMIFPVWRKMNYLPRYSKTNATREVAPYFLLMGEISIKLRSKDEKQRVFNLSWSTWGRLSCRLSLI